MKVRRRTIATLIFLLMLGGAVFLSAQQPQCPTCPLYAVNAKYLDGAGMGYAPTAGAGLVLNLSAGRNRCSNTMTNYAGGTLTLTNSTTNYVYLDTTASCAPASNTTGYTGTQIQIATVVTSGGVITTITDDRVFGLAQVVGPGTITGGSCTNQVATAISTAGVPTCTTVTSAYVNNSIALTGTDINTSNQVTATHLAAALPVNQGGTGTTSTLTGIVRGGNPMTASELSGDATTSGSNVVTLSTNVKRRGIAFSIGAPGGSALTVASTTTDYITVPIACTISGYNLLIDSGTITVKFWKVATGTAIPTSGNSISTSGVGISAGTAIHSTTVTDFTTTTVTANDIMAMNVTAVSGAAFVNGVLQCDQ